jgi:hypothetical protein
MNEDEFFWIDGFILDIVDESGNDLTEDEKSNK